MAIHTAAPGSIRRGTRTSAEMHFDMAVLLPDDLCNGMDPQLLPMVLDEIDGGRNVRDREHRVKALILWSKGNISRPYTWRSGNLLDHLPPITCHRLFLDPQARALLLLCPGRQASIAEGGFRSAAFFLPSESWDCNNMSLRPLRGHTSGSGSSRLLSFYVWRCTLPSASRCCRG